MSKTEAHEVLRDVHHIHICGDADTFCGHPRQGGIFNFGNNEIAVIHYHAPCAYQTRDDVRHDFGGYHSRAKALLQRSLDGGATWPSDQEVVIYDEARPLEERRGFVAATGPREAIDLSSPDSAIYFGRTYAGPTDDKPEMVCFALRSSDRGRTWENVPAVIHPPERQTYVHKDAHPIVRMPDGSFLAVMSAREPNQVALYGSDDNGLTWEYLSRIADDPTGQGRPTYAGLLRLSNGTLQAYTLNIHGLRNAIQVSESRDGYAWSAPRPIVRWGDSPWVARRGQGQFRFGMYYRSPWPMLLADGRILVLFGRRKPPFGLGCILSEDNGATWSREFIIRCDAEHGDLGYPVATELDDGRIFTAYYFNLPEGHTPRGARRFIAGSFFRLS